MSELFEIYTPRSSNLYAAIEETVTASQNSGKFLLMQFSNVPLLVSPLSTKEEVEQSYRDSPTTLSSTEKNWNLKGTVKNYTPSSGASLGGTIKTAIEGAKFFGEVVQFTFQGVSVIVNSRSDPAETETRYRAEAAVKAGVSPEESKGTWKKGKNGIRTYSGSRSNATGTIETAIEGAKFFGEPILVELSNVPIIVNADSNPEIVQEKHDAETRRLGEIYRNSPEGRADEAEYQAEIAAGQNRINDLVAQLPQVIQNDGEAGLVQWISNFSRANDGPFEFDHQAIAAQLRGAGYESRRSDQDTPDSETRSEFAQRLIGETIAMLDADSIIYPGFENAATSYERLPAKPPGPDGKGQAGTQTIQGPLPPDRQQGV